MSAEEKREFTFIWKIKHIHRINSIRPKIRSPFFEVEFLKGIEWSIEFIKNPRNILCRIKRGGCREFPECIPIDYQYELTTSDGDILKTSGVQRDTFSKDGYSSQYELIEFVDKDTPEDVSLRCRMVITPSMKSNPCSVVGWEAETDIVCSYYSFEFSLPFSESNEWTAVQIATVENIPIEITFRYVNDELQIEFDPEIEENSFYLMNITLRCKMYLKDDEKSSTKLIADGSEFSSTTVDRYVLHFNDIDHLEKADLITLNRLDAGLEFECEYKSIISEIESFTGDPNSVKKNAFTQNKYLAQSLLHLQKHLRNMLNEKTHADVKLRVDDEVFFAHKSLLATLSPVFKALFDQDMLESKTNIIDLQDVEAKTLKYFLEYLYTGTVEEMIDDEMALNLLVVADRYQVSQLSEKCIIFLKSVLSLDNVLNVLLVADMVNQEELKVFAVDYIVENSTKVLSSPNWPQWLKTNSMIASEVLLKLSNKLDSISNLTKV